MKNIKLINDVELPPLRSLDDFLLKSARFQIPNLKDTDKWINRVAYNLLYYQTNYMLMYLIIFLLFGLIHPVKMLTGLLVFLVISFVFIYLYMEGSIGSHLWKRYTGVGVIFTTLVGYLLMYTLGCIIVASLGIMLPLCVTFVHASLRLRNIKNRIVNKMEAIGFKRTPIGIFMEYIGDVTGFTLRAQTSFIQPPN